MVLAGTIQDPPLRDNLYFALGAGGSPVQLMMFRSAPGSSCTTVRASWEPIALPGATPSGAPRTSPPVAYATRRGCRHHAISRAAEVVVVGPSDAVEGLHRCRAAFAGAGAVDHRGGRVELLAKRPPIRRTGDAGCGSALLGGTAPAAGRRDCRVDESDRRREPVGR